MTERRMRRRSDRWLTITAIVSLWGCIGFVGYVGWYVRDNADTSTRRSATASAERAEQLRVANEAQARLAEQQADLACFADTTSAWESAITDLLLTTVRENPTDAERTAAIEQVREARERLRQAKTLCGITPPTTGPR